MNGNDVVNQTSIIQTIIILLHNLIDNEKKIPKNQYKKLRMYNTTFSIVLTLKQIEYHHTTKKKKTIHE